MKKQFRVQINKVKNLSQHFLTSPKKFKKTSPTFKTNFFITVLKKENKKTKQKN